jgi:hypothetical protein
MAAPTAYITLLRDPVQRIISDYYHRLNDPNTTYHNDIQKMNFKDYLNDSRLAFIHDNGMTRLISGDYEVEEGNCTKEMLEKAKNNIQEHFVVAGLTERFDESLWLMKRKLHWPYPYYYKKNVWSKQKNKKKAISKANVLRVREKNGLDIQLYDFVKQRFNSALQEQSSEFFEALQTFQRYNQWYSIGYSLYLKLGRLKRKINRLS